MDDDTPIPSTIAEAAERALTDGRVIVDIRNSTEWAAADWKKLAAAAYAVVFLMDREQQYAAFRAFSDFHLLDGLYACHFAAYADDRLELLTLLVVSAMHHLHGQFISPDRPGYDILIMPYLMRHVEMPPRDRGPRYFGYVSYRPYALVLRLMSVRAPMISTSSIARIKCLCYAHNMIMHVMQEWVEISSSTVAEANGIDYVLVCAARRRRPPALAPSACSSC